MTEMKNATLDLFAGSYTGSDDDNLVYNWQVRMNASATEVVCSIGSLCRLPIPLTVAGVDIGSSGESVALAYVGHKLTFPQDVRSAAPPQTDE